MKATAHLNLQFVAQLASQKYASPAQSDSKLNSRAFWYYAIVLGSIVQLSLFAALPFLAPGRFDPEIAKPIEVNFLSWQPTPKVKAKKVEKQQKAVKKEIIKPAPKPQLKPLPKPEPTPQLAPEPVKPVEQVAEQAPITPQPKQIPQQQPSSKPSETPPVEETLPTPVPEYQLSEYPSYAHEEPGTYPFEMRAQGREAIVGLDILIDKDGTVRRITVTQSQGELFDQAARDKIRRSTFLPGKSDGKPVAVLFHEKVTFKLQ